MKIQNLLKFIMTAALLAGSAASQCYAADDGAGESPKHEMRGAWVATVYGIDWPSQTGTTAAVAQAQKRELTEILDVLRSAGVNAVMFQVRSMSDAMYRSSFEPWSAYLTGTRGVAPASGWDPLKFAVDEAHRRGMELHAWVNPFRIANGQVPEPAKAAAGNNMFDPRTQGWTISYGTPEKVAATAQRSRKGKKRRRQAPKVKKKWVSVLNPALPEVRQHIVDVCREIVEKYDVDGLVFDDYFYPDRLPLGEGYDFDLWSQACVADENMSGMTQADWRRHNVNQTIRDVHDMIQATRPWVRFGVSPAGVGGGNGVASSRHGLPAVPVGNDWMYDRIFCDPLQWLADGSVDYVSPQIYWASDHATNPYAPLARWWTDAALHFGRHSFPSQKVLALPEGEAAWREQQLQVETNRANSTGTDAGEIFYSTAHISGKKACGLAAHLRQTVFASPALMPPMPWKAASDPGPVKGLVLKGNELSWYPAPDMRYVVYAVPVDVSPIDAIALTGANFMSAYILGICYGNNFQLPADKLRGYWYAVAPYDRYGNEWEASVLQK